MTALSNTALSPARPIRPLTDAEIDHVVGAYWTEVDAQWAAWAMAEGWRNTYGGATAYEAGLIGNEIPEGWGFDQGDGGNYWLVWSVYPGEWAPILTVGYIKDFTP